MILLLLVVFRCFKRPKRSVRLSPRRSLCCIADEYKNFCIQCSKAVRIITAKLREPHSESAWHLDSCSAKHPKGLFAKPQNSSQAPYETITRFYKS